MIFFIPAGITITFLMTSKEMNIFLGRFMSTVATGSHKHEDTHTVSFFLSDTRFLIIPQYSLLPLKTPIKYE